MSYPDEFDRIHKDLVAGARLHEVYAHNTETAIYGYSEGAEHALDSVRLRLNRIKAQALREAADELGAAGPPGVAWWYTGWIRRRAAELDQKQ